MSGAPPPDVVVAAIRTAAPRAVAAMTRRTGSFADAEDAVQEALVVAARRWPVDGPPADPVAWLVAVAVRRWIDAVRSEAARREREVRVATLAPSGPARESDDDLALLLLSCHPALPPASRIALTLRAVGGLTTREVARGLLADEATVGQRISRAKAALRRLDAPFAPPPSGELPTRVAAALDVIGLIHTEAHTAADGDAIARPGLSAEALRLARMLLAAAPVGASWRGEAMGLVALILLTDARAPARTGPGGALVPLAEQDRSRWDRAMIAEGTALVAAALTDQPIGPFQLRAAIAAVHDEAPDAAATDRRQILGLYDLLVAVDPGPVAALGRVVALGEVRGPAAALAMLEAVGPTAPAKQVEAVRARLLLRAGRTTEARAAFATAGSLTRNAAERRWFAEHADQPVTPR